MKYFSCIALFVLMGCQSEEQSKEVKKSSWLDPNLVVQSFYTSLKSENVAELSKQFNGRTNEKEAIIILQDTDSTFGNFLSYDVLSISSRPKSETDTSAGSYVIRVIGTYEKTKSQEQLVVILNDTGYYYERYTRIPR